MSKTTLQFLRKAQCLSDIQKERPTSIQNVRQALHKAIHDTEVQLNDVERSFYGGQNFMENIREMSIHCRELMPVFQISNWNDSEQTQSIWKKVTSPSCVDDYEKHMASIRELHTFDLKLKEFLPDKFQGILSDIRNIVHHIKKYLLSFYKGKNEAYLETCHHYQRRTAEFDEAIDMHLKNVEDMAKAYRGEGLGVKHFGLHVNEVARACSCGDLPILLAIPQVSQNIRNSLKGLVKWLEADEEYVDFLRNDLKSLEVKREVELNKLNVHKDTCWTLEHRLQNTHREAMDIKNEILRLADREKQLNETIYEFENQIRSMEIEIDMKERERDILLRKIKENEDMETEEKDAVNERLHEVVQMILSRRNEILATRRKIESVKTKTKLITKKRKQLNDKKLQMRKIQDELNDARGQAVYAEAETKRIENAIHTMKDIIAKKCANDLPKKIFYQLPIKKNVQRKVRSSRPSGVASARLKGGDPLEAVIRFVAQHLDHDWVRLYRNLPFYPPRGQANLDADINHLVQANYRTNNVVMARESLQQWRRQHTLASVPELRQALVKIGRTDIVERLNHPPSPRPKTRRMAKGSCGPSRSNEMNRNDRMFPPAMKPGVLKESHVVTGASKGKCAKVDDLMLPKIIA